MDGKVIFQFGDDVKIAVDYNDIKHGGMIKLGSGFECSEILVDGPPFTQISKAEIQNTKPLLNFSLVKNGKCSEMLVDGLIPFTNVSDVEFENEKPFLELTLVNKGETTDKPCVISRLGSSEKPSSPLSVNKDKIVIKPIEPEVVPMTKTQRRNKKCRSKRRMYK